MGRMYAKHLQHPGVQCAIFSFPVHLLLSYLANLTPESMFATELNTLTLSDKNSKVSSQSFQLLLCALTHLRSLNIRRYFSQRA